MNLYGIHEPTLRKATSFLLLFTIISFIPFYVYYKLFSIWLIFLLGYFIFQIGFIVFSSIVMKIIYFRFPSFFLQFTYSRNPDLDFAILVSSSVAFIFFLFTESIIIGIAFLILFSFGFIFTEIRKHLLISLILIVPSIILFYYALQQGKILIYLISTFLVIFTPFGLDELIGRNLMEKSPSPYRINSLVIILLSFTLFFYYIIHIKVLYIIGIIGVIYFGMTSLSLILESLLLNKLVFTKEDTFLTFFLSLEIFSLIFFGIFVFFEKSIYMYIIASLSMFIGSIGFRLFLKRYFSDEMSKSLITDIGRLIFGVLTIIFYLIFFKDSLVLGIGTILVLYSFMIIQIKIRYAKDEN